MKDNADGLFWHGVDAKTGAHSCCKWGRANGWTLMMQAEVIDALSASSWPGVTAAKAVAVAAFQAHCEALAQAQAPDGRWHQVLTNASTYLESSGTAMYIVSMAQGLERGWLDPSRFSAVITKAWAGLATQIHADGVVTGICDGFGIHAVESDYAMAPALYSRSEPGLGSVLKAAVLMATRGAKVAGDS